MTVSRKCSACFFGSLEHTWRPISYYSSPFCVLHSHLPQTAIQPLWPPCCSWNPPDVILPQDLGICLFLDLECSSPNTHSLYLLQIFAQILLSWSNETIFLRDKGKTYHSQGGSKCLALLTCPLSPLALPAPAPLASSLFLEQDLIPHSIPAL